MAKTYFSEREYGLPPRISEKIEANVWGGIVSAISNAIADGSLGFGFPDNCLDPGAEVIGTDFRSMGRILQAEVRGAPWPLDPETLPPVAVILDVVEFVHEHIAKPVKGTHHEYFRHHHLSFDREAGQKEFRERINRMFGGNGIAFELNETGEISRLGPPGTSEILKSAVFSSGDRELDDLLETARKKFFDPDLSNRSEALEKLWDGWERLKTLLNPDKKAGITALLERAVPEPKLRTAIGEEAKALTEIGNSFRIRHAEVTQTPIEYSEHVDYLFHRLFSLIWLLLSPPAQ